MKRIATLSTIPPRFSEVSKTCISLLSQELPFDEIRVYIPEYYRRFPEWDGKLPDLPKGVTLHRCCNDYGPATKVLPVVKDLKAHEAYILFCDDDKIYDAQWHKEFAAFELEKPHTCIIEVGETFPDIADSIRLANRLLRGRRQKKGAGYRLICLGSTSPTFT